MKKGATAGVGLSSASTMNSRGTATALIFERLRTKTSLDFQMKCAACLKQKPKEGARMGWVGVLAGPRPEIGLA